LINSIFVFRIKRVRLAVLKVIDALTGTEPSLKRNSPEVDRAIYMLDKSTMIINHTMERMLHKLGFPSCAIGLPVEEPIKAAEIAKRIFNDAGINVSIFDDAEPDVPKGFLVFMTSSEFNGIVLVFQTKNPSPEVIAQLTPAEPWNWD
jgi:hypothetical protein